MNLSVPYSERSEALKNHIRQEINNAGGHINFARFMELALYTPNLGYYNADPLPFGPDGDFITAPTLSPLFTRCVVNQFLPILEVVPHILEIGAGSGVFAKDALLELEKQQKLPEIYFILEISLRLREHQRELLQSECPHLLPRVQWVEACPENFRGIIFANEVLDALPVHCFRFDKGDWFERVVTWENNQFGWKLMPAPIHFSQHLEAIELPDDYESEINFAIAPWIQSLARNLAQGVMLLFDYGYGRREYYHPDRTRGTLMCFHQHRAHEDPFWAVGMQDMTAHVDFTTVVESAMDAGLQLGGYTTQAGFLLSCGLLAQPQNYQQNQDVKTMVLPSQMGELIKVMALTKNFDLPLQGFTMHDRRRDL